MTDAAQADVALQARRKIALRILPLVFVLYLVNYLDRANLSFAQLTMTEDLKFSQRVYGLGTGVFYIGYLALEIPGALIVERWSARLWFTRILITWGLCTVWVGFVRTPLQFCAARFCLGLAEAGFYPGIIVYLMHWFPLRDRARALAGLLVAIPAGLCLGGPISAALVHQHWLGLSGWQWIFILQGLPAVVLGFVAMYCMSDRPQDAGWLKPEERDWLVAELEAEKRLKGATAHFTILQSFKQRNVLLLAAALFIANIDCYGFMYWLPALIRDSLPASVRENSPRSTWIAMLCSAAPWFAAAVAALLAGRLSDRIGRRRLMTVVPMVFVAMFFVLAAIPGQPFWLVMTWLILTGAAFFAYPPSFWVLPTLTLSASAAAASIGMINSIGNFSGFVAPTIVGEVLDKGYTYNQVVPFLAACTLLAAICVACVRVPANPESKQELKSVLENGACYPGH